MSFSPNNISSLVDSNGVWGLVNGVNVAADGFLAYVVLLVVFVVSSYYIIRSTSDIEKGLLQAGFVTFMIGLVLFFAGKSFGVDFVPDIVMLFLMVGLSVGTAVVYFLRTER